MDQSRSCAGIDAQSDEGAKEVGGRKRHDRIWATELRVENRIVEVGGSAWTRNGLIN